jgi:hypothetical protein
VEAQRVRETTRFRIPWASKRGSGDTALRPEKVATPGPFCCYNGALHLVTHESSDGSSSAGPQYLERKVLAFLDPESHQWSSSASNRIATTSF